MTRSPANPAKQMKHIVIAEKPSVAADLARALDGFTKHGDHYESPTMLITAAAGHLLESTRPGTWDLEDLPHLPPQLVLVPKEAQKKRLADIVALLERDDVAGVINACDAGREGELIFLEIMRHARCTKPVRRLWLQSMAAAAIRRAFEELRPQSAVQGLADAAVCRSIADWWIGINMTKALTGIMKRAGHFDLTPAGRVQTPTLMLVCDRDREIESFVPRPFWLLTGSFEMADGRVVDAAWTAQTGNEDGDDRGRRIAGRDRAETIVQKTLGQPATVISGVRLERKAPPMLYKLNDLLSDASSLYGFPADRTQSIVQSLYEKKLITYPRTESRHLRPEDDVDTVRERLVQITAAVPDLAAPARDALARGIDATNKRVFDSSKVGDHFAIIPADVAGDASPLTEGERKIYELVVRRFVAAFLPASETQVDTLTFTVAGETFVAVTRTLLAPGWRAVEGRVAEASPVPRVGATDTSATAQAASVSMDERISTPPHGHFTDGTLLKAMESAGALVADEEAQEAMRGTGLGTAATRTQTIKKLLGDGYLERHGRELHATPRAFALQKALKALSLEVLTSPEMTGKWESRLAEIESDTAAADSFMADIRHLTEELVARTVGSPIGLVLETLPDLRVPGNDQPIVELLQDYATADGAVRIPKFAWGRYLAPKELRSLLTTGLAGPLKGFFSPRTRKHFDGSLRWNTTSNRYVLVFDRPADPITDDHPQIGVCRHCGGTVHERPSSYVCVNATGSTRTCGFTVKKLWCERLISRDEVIVLLTEGRTPPLAGFRGKNGRSFRASLAIGDGGKVGFEFADTRATRGPRKA